MAKGKATGRRSGRPGRGTTAESVAAIRRAARRKNIPPAGLEAQGRVGQAPVIRYEYIGWSRFDRVIQEYGRKVRLSLAFRCLS